MWVAGKVLWRRSRTENMSFVGYIREGSDVMRYVRCLTSSVAVFMEDSAAVLGIGIAAGSLMLSEITNTVYFDALGSIMIGNLLGGVAVFLIRIE